MYNANASFRQSSLSALEPVLYDGVLSYTADLFENFMEYKSLVKSVQLMLADPDKYQGETLIRLEILLTAFLAAQLTEHNSLAINKDIPTLLAVKAALRREMDKIVEVVSNQAAHGDMINIDLIRWMYSHMIRPN